MTPDEAFLAEEAAIEADIRSRLPIFGTGRENLIPILQMIQEKHAYLPNAAIGLVAEHLAVSASDVFGVATFYNQFRFHPPGRNPIKVCLGTACHVRGGEIILESFERKLEIKDGETTPDREFSLERVACVGCCALAPVAVMDDTVHGKMVPSKVEGLVLRVTIERERHQREQQKESQNESNDN